MPLIAELSRVHVLLLAAMLAITACALVWTLAALRWRHGQPVAPYEPRRPVPWRAVDVSMVVVFYLVVLSGIVRLATLLFDSGASRADAIYCPGQSTADHIVAQLVVEGNVWIFLLCLASVAVVAPVTEEFLFRVLLQGWLETLHHRWRRQMPVLRRMVPNGLGPILLTSLLFAGVHFRVGAPPVNARFVVVWLASDAIARLLTLAFALGLLHWGVGATAADFGWATSKIQGDVTLGLAAFAAIAAPIYTAQIVLRLWLPSYIAPDPLPLFFLALLLGTLYYRTHRIMPLIVVHAALNGTSLLLAWFGG